MDEIERIKKVYREKYKVDWKDRSYIWHPRNPVSHAYTVLTELELLGFLNKYDVEVNDARILDVGCGYGRILRFFLELGAKPSNLHGIDLMEYRIERARLLNPDIDYKIADAQSLPFQDEAFDIAIQFVAFSSILDAGVRKKIASEISRVLKRDGLLIWCDMKEDIPPSSEIIGFSREDILVLFPGFKALSLKPILYDGLIKEAGRFPRLSIVKEFLPWTKKTQYMGLLRKRG